MNGTTSARPLTTLARTFALGCLALSLVGALAGCGGPEAQTPTPAATGAPGGVSMDDYKKHMQEVGKPGGGAAAVNPGAGAAAPAPDKK